MKEKRTLIETFLPVEEISQESKDEKKGNARPARTVMHYWWTRKPLIASRAAVLGALLPEDFDVNEFKRLLFLGRKKRAHNYNLTKTQLNKLKTQYKMFWGTETPTVFDPFSGGGSIPFEALRLGCNVIANDYNPVANLILKASLEYPMKYNEKLVKDVKTGFEWIIKKAKEKLEFLYPLHNGKVVTDYIYAWVVECPNCGFKNPLVSQWWINKKSQKIYLDYKIVKGKLQFQMKEGKDVPPKNMAGKSGKCLNPECGKSIPGEHIKKEINEKEEEILLAVVLSKKRGKDYDLPIESDLKALKKAEDLLNDKWDEFVKEDLIPLEEMPDDLRGGIWAKSYLKYWHRLMNPRQKILFATLIKLTREYIESLNCKEDYKKAIGTYMSFLLGRHIDYNCRSAIWDRSTEKVSHVLTNKGIPMTWDHVEPNPFIKGSGSLPNMANNIESALKYSIDKLTEKNELQIFNESIIDTNFKVPIIVTDPPYFDDVQYAELSEFFYILEKRALKNIVDLPSQTPKSEDLSVGGKRKPEVFKHLFKLSCKKMHSMLEDNGIMVMFFAHSTIEAWDFVIDSLMESKFIITATWPVHTENPNSPAAKDKASLMSSIMIVARKRVKEKKGYYEEIKSYSEPILKERIKKFWDYGLRGADITVAAMGATLDILTQYSEIKSISGEKKVSDILEQSQIYVVQHILNKFLKDSESLDPETGFYMYCRLNGLDKMTFDTASLISKSLNIDLNVLKRSGIIKEIIINKKKGIKLLNFQERDTIELDSIIGTIHSAMAAYEKAGENEFNSLIIESPYSQSEIFNVISSFQYLKNSDPEKQIAIQILGKSADFIPEKGQTTLD